MRVHPQPHSKHHEGASSATARHGVEKWVSPWLPREVEVESRELLGYSTFSARTSELKRTRTKGSVWLLRCIGLQSGGANEKRAGCAILIQAARANQGVIRRRMRDLAFLFLVVQGAKGRGSRVHDRQVLPVSTYH